MGGAREHEPAATTPALDDTRPSASDAAVTAIGGARASGACIGRYELRTCIGAGAMGEVWIAFDPQLDRELAIKLVHPRLARSPDVAARMLREARAMAKLSHRGVVAIHDAGEVDGELFLAMELVRGRTLGQLLRARTAEDQKAWRRWLAIVIDAGRGLAAAHAAGVLHRDFKPDNVLVEEGGRVCVGDLGLATVGETRRTSQPDLQEQAEIARTATGALLGTPAYMSLEQLHGHSIDARADQFSFCVVAYEALYGERPFEVPERANLAELDEALSAGAIRPPPAGSQVPSELRALLLRGLATSPADRWPDLAALLAALDAARDVAGPGHRRRWIAVAAAAAAVVAGASIALRSHRATGLLGPSPRVHVIERSAAGTRALDPSVAASELGWTAGGDYLMWNRATRAVERIRASGGPPLPTRLALEAEPMNATLAGNLVIVAERAEGGRVLVARDLATGVTAWRDPPGRSLAARCARDLAPPCYVARRAGDPEERYDLVPLDPHTGAALGPAIYCGPLEDFAVSPDGRRVLVADGGALVRELDAQGTPLATLDTHLGVVRSVAYDPAGGELVAGAGSAGSDVVERLDGGAATQLTIAAGPQLSLVRPSPASGEILTLGRTLASELWQVPRRP